MIWLFFFFDRVNPVFSRLKTAIFLFLMFTVSCLANSNDIKIKEKPGSTPRCAICRAEGVQFVACEAGHETVGVECASDNVCTLLGCRKDLVAISVKTPTEFSKQGQNKPIKLADIEVTHKKTSESFLEFLQRAKVFNRFNTVVLQIGLVAIVPLGMFMFVPLLMGSKWVHEAYSPIEEYPELFFSYIAATAISLGYGIWMQEIGLGNVDLFAPIEPQSQCKDSLDAKP